MGRPQNKVKYPGKLLMRLINYIFRDYKVHCIAVFILIFVGVIANVQGTMFTRDRSTNILHRSCCLTVHRTFHRLHMQLKGLRYFTESESLRLTHITVS